MKKGLLLLMAAGSLLSCAISKKSSKANSVQSLAIAKADTTKKDSTKKIKPYNEVITSKAITQNGLLTVHRLNDRFFIEVPDSILDKDLLLVNRVAKSPAGVRPNYGLFASYAGDEIGESVIQFSKGPNQKLFLRKISFVDFASDSSENGLYHSLINSNLQPIVAGFDMKAITPDSTAVVIDLTDYLNTDNNIFSFDVQAKKLINLGGLQPDKSYIETISSFPMNVEIKTMRTYEMQGQFVTYGLSSSIISLPGELMKTRQSDDRVGYFARDYRDFDFPQNAKNASVITRWRLEPKDEDIEKYKKGELVEPKKPIIFYIDPATPRKWVPYLIQGVNAWQRAFEKAGFKNAILALEVSKEDSTWSLDDARHNVIVYKPSFVQNASGPQINDPRTGEILESHVNWYHNVQKILHDWYFLQASPNDPRARTMNFSDSLMGQLIRYVCTHEIGHTLGLKHNFISSATVPTDSLRSRSYVARNGYTPSIMDYARFNYVAQPEDGIAVNDLIPHIGIYDDWAIEWGYRYVPVFSSKEEEKSFFNKWIIENIEKDKRLLYASNQPDCRIQMEDLGDDPVKSGTYGIKNLKRVMSNLVEWTRTPNENYEGLVEMQNALYGQYMQYLDNVYMLIGGVYWLPKTVEQGGPVLTFVKKKKQRIAVQFFIKQLFDSSDWLNNKQIFSLTGGRGEFLFDKIQEYWLHMLVDPDKYFLSVFQESTLPKDSVYSFDELLNDLETGVWRELKNHKAIQFQRRNLQKIYVSKLIDFVRIHKIGLAGRSDATTIIENHIRKMYREIKTALPKYDDPVSKMHLEDVLSRLKVAIYHQERDFPENDPYHILSQHIPPASINDKKVSAQSIEGCWNVSNDWMDWEK